MQPVFTAEDIDYDANCILRREITPTGKSRAFINDTPVTLESLRKVGTFLMDIHSQHDTLQLGDSAYQLNILDLYAGNQKELERYQTVYKNFKKLEAAYKKLESELAQSNKELDYHTFLLNELSEAKLTDGEQEELESELKQLEHAEEIKLKLSQALQYLSDGEMNVVLAMKDASHLLGQVSAYSDSFQSLKERLDSSLIELNDIAAEVETAERKTEADPQRLEVIQDRLNLLYTLQRKHSVRTVAELILIEEDLANKVSGVHNLDAAIEKTKKEMTAAATEVEQTGKTLSESRKKVFPKFESELHSLLSELGMPNARIVV